MTSAGRCGLPTMRLVTCQISVSLDGFVASPNQSRTDPLGEPVGDVPQPSLALRRQSPLDLLRRDGGEVLEHRDVLRRPGPGLVVRKAEGPEHVTTAGPQRNTGVGADLAGAHRDHVPHQGVPGGIGDDQRLSGRDGELAQRRTQRPRTGRVGSLVELGHPGHRLPVPRHQGDEGLRRPDQPRGEAGQPVEGGVAALADQATALDRLETLRITEDGQRLGRALVSGQAHRTVHSR